MAAENKFQKALVQMAESIGAIGAPMAEALGDPSKPLEQELEPRREPPVEDEFAHLDPIVNYSGLRESKLAEDLDQTRQEALELLDEDASPVETLEVFKQLWFDRLVEKGIPGLVATVLEGQDLDEYEIKSFMRALPDSLVQDICDSELSNGLHAMFAIENHFRMGNIDDYTVHQTKDGRLFLYHVSNDGEAMNIYLDEEFQKGDEEEE